MLYAVVAAVAVGVGLQPLVVRAMTSAAVLDIPSDRSSHSVPTPRGGGVAVVAAAASALLLVAQARSFVIPVLLCGVIGLVEDVRGVPILQRLVSQMVVGVATALLLMRPGTFTIGWLAVVGIIALWLATFVNVFNFMDGINGISAMYAALAGGIYAVIGIRHGLGVLVGAGIVIGAAALSFLPWNVGRARIFLGDVGSYGLGAGLGALAVYAVLHNCPVEEAIAPLAVYLVDTGWTLLRRIVRGEAWYQPHRTHVYQRLTDIGWSHELVAVMVVGVAGVASTLALLGSERGPVVRSLCDAGVGGLLIVYLMSPRLLVFSRRRRRTSSRSEEVELYA